MKVITLLNEKGGVGKTTLAVHIAAGLAIKGYRVLLIDADPQAHSTQWLRLPETGGLYHLLVGQRTGEILPNADDIPEWVTFKLLRLAYHDAIVRVLTRYGSRC